MRLRLTARVALARGPVYNPGEHVDLPDVLAQQLLDDGLAVVDDRPVPPVVAAFDAPPRATMVARGQATRKHRGGP